MSLEELLLRHAVGLEVAGLDREARAAGVMMIPIPHAGILQEVRGRAEAEAVPDIEEVRIVVPAGSRLLPPPEGARYLGFIFARAETPSRAEASLREAHRRMEFRIVPEAAS
jgi:hypothetical protein